MIDTNASRVNKPMKFVVKSIDDLPQSLADMIARFPKDYSVEVVG